LLFQKSLVVALSAALVVSAQQPASQLTSQAQGSLKINAIQGEGAKNSLRARTGVAPAVEVRDADDKPVAGAEVIFQLPMVGPSGVFNGWLKSQTVRTDENGVAASSGYAPNSEAGRFNIKVTASTGSQTGSAVIAQSNVEGDSSASGGGRSAWWKYVAVIGGAAVAGGVVAATRNGNDTAPAASIPITITAGAVTVGNPR